MSGRRDSMILQVLSTGAVAAPTASVTEFFRGLRLSNGTCKTTGAGRLAELDQRLVAQLGTPRDIRVLDAGASIGVTTLDLLDALQSRGFLVACTLVDLSISARILSRFGITFLVDPNGAVLCAEFGSRRVFRPDPSKDSLRSRVGRALFSATEAAIRVSGVWSDGGQDVQLLVPGARARSEITALEHDLFDPLPLGSTYHVVRAANILNRAYFSETQLSTLIGNLLQVLQVGGLLVVCRTDEAGMTAGSILRREVSGDLVVVERVRGGSEVESLVLSAGQAPVA